MLQFFNIITVIGAIYTAALVIKAVRSIQVYFLPSNLQRYAHISADGLSPWALVTGSSDGIGYAFAKELALRGFNIVLHGRNKTKLNVVRSKLQKKHPKTLFRILVADASTVQCVNCLRAGKNQPQQSLSFNAIKDELADLHLTVLVNNAGGGTKDPVYLPLGDSSEHRITENVSVNALFPLHLTRVLLPHLARSSPALVMNVSSMADTGFPLIASYSASKGFLMTLTRAIRLEVALLGQADIECLGIRVGNVTAVSHNKEPPSLFTPTADIMARAALDRAGHGHTVTIGYWAHALQQATITCMPAFIVDKIMINAICERRDIELKSN
ncbi:short chain dehydrogenase [Trichoderma arundinaceum]|uniref:Short chain dehydrogenase n=1 Tax=Trichoderma arundinaceum TaxID=490622 RepID=A0A395NFL6_TRIAR|nr:short chain dehydrogenase [Trichoderma arundinaceum]